MALHHDPVAASVQQRIRVLGAFAVVYFVWGSTYLAIDVGIETLPPLWMAAMRFLFAGIVLMAWGRLRGSPWPGIEDFGQATIVGALMLSLGNGALSIAETKMPIGVAALLIATVPMWLVVLEAARARRRPRNGVVVGLVVGLTGVALLAGVADGWTGGRVDPMFVGLILGGAFAWAYGSLLSRQSAVTSMRMRAGSQMLGGGLVLLLMGITWEPQPAWGAITLRSWGALAYLSVFGSILAFTSYVWLLRTVSSAAVGTYAFVNPLVALGLGAWLLNEPMTGRSAVAAGLILAAVILINRSEARGQRANLPAAYGVTPRAEARRADELAGGQGPK